MVNHISQTQANHPSSGHSTNVNLSKPNECAKISPNARRIGARYHLFAEPEGKPATAGEEFRDPSKALIIRSSLSRFITLSCCYEILNELPFCIIPAAKSEGGGVC
ncbi:MAG: hypothetical protein DRO11_08100 [Methanobacteriota archaeon]|nr:MAG: hypothetical protein DRO11_08100 [Euryarchaeota archaeon]